MSVSRNLGVFFGLLSFVSVVSAFDAQPNVAAPVAPEGVSTQVSNNVVAAPAPAKQNEVAAPANVNNNVVNINSADVDTLQKVKGIGKTKAKAIVKYRAKKGTFNSVEDLLNVKCKGVNKKWLNKVKEHLEV